jgi:hypothetical protein
MRRHADRGDDAVDREHHVEHQYLADRRGESEAGLAAVEQVGARIGIDAVMDLLGRLPDQEHAAGDQDQVAPGKVVAEQTEHRIGELHDEGDRAEQHEPQQQRAADADTPRPGALILRQLVGQDRDEDQVVDAEHDLHHDQGGERRPGMRVGGERQQVVHGGPIRSVVPADPI